MEETCQPEIIQSKQESNINFVTLDKIPELEDPSPEDPCGLYLEGLNYHWDGHKFDKFLKKIEIKYQNSKKKRNDYVGIIYFENNQDRKDSYIKLITVRFGEKKLFVVPLLKDQTRSRNLCRRVRARAIDDLSNANINDLVTSWYKIPLEEQYKQKSEKYSQLISKIVPKDSSLMQIYPVSNNTNYRNKVELTIGRQLDDSLCVGFNLGSKDQDVIAPIDDCLNVPKIAPILANKFKEFLENSKIPIYDRLLNHGVWKFLVIRTTEDNQVMLVVVTYGTLPEDEIERLKKAFENDVNSLWYIETKSFESFGKDFKMNLLSGTPTIDETLRGLKFEISPLSFFQTNTPGAEILFEKIEQLAEVNSNTILIDVCCGTGVIGLAMANKVHSVIGIDIEESSINDAKKNAIKNNINNSEFITGKAEDLLSSILQKYENSNYNIIAIVDPPRSGLHKNALNALMACSQLKRIVYISCNPESLVSNSDILFRDKSRKGFKVFQPKNWFGVDLFPHTDRVELVMLMERD